MQIEFLGRSVLDGRGELFQSLLCIKQCGYCAIFTVSLGESVCAFAQVHFRALEAATRVVIWMSISGRMHFRDFCHLKSYFSSFCSGIHELLRVTFWMQPTGQATDRSAVVQRAQLEWVMHANYILTKNRKRNHLDHLEDSMQINQNLLSFLKISNINLPTTKSWRFSFISSVSYRCTETEILNYSPF